MPSTVDSWRSVAHERSVDSRRLKEQQRCLAAVYVLGYVIECYLKAYLLRIGKKPPTSGRSGHDLRGLWEAAGLKPHDFTAGKRWFVQQWYTGLRYEVSLPENINFEDLCSEGYKLIGFIQNKIRWAKEGRR